MKIIPLGTAGFIPTNGKETISCLLVSGETAIMFDAGTGVRNLTDPRVARYLQKIEVLNVLFSHFHHDHTSGFTWLLRLWDKRVKVYVPEPPLIEFDGKRALETLTTLPFFGLNIESWPNCDGVTSFTESRVSVGGVTVETIKQSHSGGSVGFRVGQFAFITDTEPREAHIEFLKGCDLVLMDTMHDSTDYAKLDKSPGVPAQHGYSIGNAGIAKAAGIKRLGLIHVDPLYSEGRIETLIEETREIFTEAFLPEEIVALDV